MSDDDNSYGCAPSSESYISACNDEQDTEERLSDEVSCEDIDDIIDVMFGHEEEPVQEVQSPTETSPIPVMLHWENGREIEEEPAEKMEELPSSIKEDGIYVTDFSWTSNLTSSFWNKFHDFYEPQGLFSKSKLDFTSNKIKLSSYLYMSDLYQKKYSALGIVTGRKSMGNINLKMHMVLGEPTITRR